MKAWKGGIKKALELKIHIFFYRLLLKIHKKNRSCGPATCGKQ
jgi:hypothetical protein